jgi:phosphopantetheinyl transferase
MPEIFVQNITDTQIYIWKITETVPELLSVLGRQQDIDWQRFKSEVHQKQYLAKQILLKKLKSDAELSYLSNGKPVLSNGQFISITHSRYFVAIAVADKPIGIDLDFVQSKLKRVASKFIHQSEYSWVDFDDLHQLLYVWTAKESIYKLIGQSGLSFRNDIEVYEIDIKKHLGSAMVRGNQEINLHFNRIDEDIILCQAQIDKKP